MKDYATARLIYGYIDNDETLNLFEQLKRAEEQDKARYYNICTKHMIHPYLLGPAEKQCLQAYYADTYAPGLNYKVITVSDLDSEKYKKRIHSFLEDLSIPKPWVEPAWYLITYLV